MAAFNAERTISSAVDSILAQDYRDLELVVINDGSTDRTLDILEQYARADSRVILLSHQNVGLTKSLNIGLSVATGTYVARQDADDISLPQRIRRQVSYLSEHPSCILLGTDVQDIDDNGVALSTIRNSRRKNLKSRLKTRNQFIHGTLMFPRVINDDPVLYNEYYVRAQDYELCLRLSRFGEIAILPEVLYQFRFSRFGMTSSNVLFFSKQVVRNNRRIESGLSPEYPSATRQQTTPVPDDAVYFMNLGVRCMGGYDNTAARKYFASALKLSCSNLSVARSKVITRSLAWWALSLVPATVLAYVRERILT